MARVIEECKRHQRLLNESIDKINSEVRNVEKGQQAMITALCRLVLLFPYTLMDDLYRLVELECTSHFTVGVNRKVLAVVERLFSLWNNLH